MTIMDPFVFRENEEGEIYGGLENEFQLKTLAAGLKPDTDSTSRKIDIS